jgi:hypothetical protein
MANGVEQSSTRLYSYLSGSLDSLGGFVKAGEAANLQELITNAIN